MPAFAHLPVQEIACVKLHAGQIRDHFHRDAALRPPLHEKDRLENGASGYSDGYEVLPEYEGGILNLYY